jgi:hypothetical protein
MSDQIVREILASARVGFKQYTDPGGHLRSAGVYITSASQLVGTYCNLGRFQKSQNAYFGWHKHHIVEIQDLDRLGISGLFPPESDQICVLLPEKAHVGRINSLLRRENPKGLHHPLGVVAIAREFLRGYEAAYEFVGDYCGGGERLIRLELISIVGAILKKGGIKL